MNILSQIHLNTTETAETSEISLIVRFVFPSGSSFPVKVVGQILTEVLAPLDIHLFTTSRQGFFRVVFKNERILRHFFHHTFYPHPVVIEADVLDPVHIEFSFESMPCECCDKTLAKCLTSSLNNLGVDINPIPQTGIFSFQFPSPNSLFVAFMGLFQNLGAPLSI